MTMHMRKQDMYRAVAVFVLLIWNFPAYAEGPEKFSLTWTFDVTKASKDTQGRILLAIPIDTPYQTLTYDTQGAIFQDVSRRGDCRIVAVAPTSNPFTIRAVVTLKEHSYVKLLQSPSKANIPSELAPYLLEDATRQSRSAKLHKLATELKAKTPIATVENICKWLTTNIQYKYDVATWRYQRLDELLDRGFTECNGYSALFTALCRLNGIPTRMVWGVLKSPTEFLGYPAGTFMSHNWNEVYFAGVGWVPIDLLDRATTIGVAPKNRIRICPIGFGENDSAAFSRLGLSNFGQMAGNYSIPKYEALSK